MKLLRRILLLTGLYLIINKPQWLKENVLPYLRQGKDAMNEKTTV
ncbi:MAG: hypothetical protein WEB89_00075 [Balneolales bacterium]